MQKGVLMSEALKAKIDATKHKNLLQKMNWTFAEPYLDVELKGSKNRNKLFFTLRQYKDKMSTGITQEQMRTEGFSKHLIQFCSNFCQGKIKILKDQFCSEYRLGKTLDQIGEEYNITREDITYLRQLYKIDRLGASYQQRKATEISLTQKQKELIYGSLMGDGKKVSVNAVGFGHGKSQREYLMWKFNELYSVVSKNSLKRYTYLDKRYNTEGEEWRCYTHANSDIEIIINNFYKSGKKEISKEILNNITPFGVAVWFMDDGTTDFYWNTPKKPIVSFCTESFSQCSCELIKNWFKEKYNISVTLKERKLKNSIGYRIIINNESVNDFFDLIRPYILPYFLYKIDYKEYCQKRQNKIK